MIWSKAYENEVQDRNTTNQGDSPMNTIKTSKEINHKYSNQKSAIDRQNSHHGWAGWRVPQL
jgi:hypothetical protein